MRRRAPAFILGLAALLGLILLAAAFALLAPVGPPLPPPDLQRLMPLPDGGALPLGKLLSLARAQKPLTMEAAAELDRNAGAAGIASPAATDREADAGLPDIPFWRDPIFVLAEQQREQGRLEDALALYQSFTPRDGLYALAQRRIAWDILVLGRNDPASARTYIRRSLRADPFSGNGWQDTFRVHARLMGLPVD